MPIVISQNLLLFIVLTVVAAIAWAVVTPLVYAARELQGQYSKNALLLILLIATSAFFVSPRLASELSVSDTIEYSSAAQRLWESGSYSIGIAGQALPPRYPPFFSAFIVLPGYIFGGDALGYGVLGVTVFAVVGVMTAFYLGALLGGAVGGIISAVLLILAPEYRSLARAIWIDVPITCIALSSMLAYLLLLKNSRQVLLFACAGIAIALAVGMRSTSVIFALPLLYIGFKSQRRILAMSAIVAPSLVVLALNFLYNSLVFGAPLRSGYNYWVSIPYDFPALTFSGHYILENLKLLLNSASFVPITCAILVGYPLMKRFAQTNAETNANLWRNAALFTLAFGALLLIVFLPYFYCTRRFFLPVTALSVVLCAGLIGRCVSTSRSKAVIDSVIVIGLALTLISRLLTTHPIPSLELAKQLQRSQHDAVIISGLNPAYLERLVLKGSQREFVPVSREVEFASKIIAAVSLAERMAVPQHWMPHRTEATLRAGAKDVYEWTALEAPHNIAAFIKAGRQVILDSRFSSQTDIAALSEHFALKHFGQNTFELELLK